jgi:hypothetical protein
MTRMSPLIRTSASSSKWICALFKFVLPINALFIVTVFVLELDVFYQLMHYLLPHETIYFFTVRLQLTNS